VSVFLNGVKLKNSDFTHSGTAVTLVTPATLNDVVTLEGFTQSAVPDLTSLPTLAASGGSALVGTIQSGADAVATTVQSKLRRTFYAADFTSVQKAIDRAAVEGGGVVIADNFSWNTNITIPSGVDLIGQRGKHGTTFTATGANAKLTFLGENRGGASGGFTLDGAGLSTLLLEIGVSVARTFQDMKVHQSAQDGAWLKGTQNCLFSEVDFEHCARDNFILDLGAGNNLFVKCEFNRGGKKSLKIVQSGASPTGAFPSGPTSNHFLQCVVERLGWVSPSNLGDPNTGDNIIYIGAGSDNIFTGGSFGLADSTPALSTTKSMIKLVRDNVSYPNQGTVFNNVAIQGDNPYTTAFEVGPNCELILQGVTKFENHLTAIGADDLASIRLLGIETYGTVTNKFANINAGTAAFEALARHTLRGRRIYEASTVGQVISEVSVSGDANARLVRYPFADVYGSGSSAARATVGGGMDFGIPTLQLSDFNGGAEFLIKKGAVYEYHTTAAGVPTIALPNGSVAYSSNGNGAVYIRIAGAWQTLTIP
jgi:hypothetical protein